MSDSYPRPDAPEGEPTSEGRNPVGWLALGLLLLIAVYGLVVGFTATKKANQPLRQLDDLRSTLVMREIGHRFGVANEGLLKLERDVAPTRKKDAESAAIWTAVRTELGEAVTPQDFALALASPRIDLRTIGEAYALRPAPRDAAAQKAAVLDERGPLSHLAAMHLRQAAGLPNARGWIKAEANRYFAALALMGSLGLASLVAWILLAVASSSGSVPNLGPPDVAHGLPDADRLAMRAAALFAGFEVLSLAFGSLRFSTPLKSVAVGLAMFAYVPLVLRRRPSFEEAVGATRFFGRKVLLGLWAFLLEIPVTMIVAGIGAAIFRNLPQNEHPATTALMNTHDAATIASLLFFGAIAAPFWEETMFRGLLYPALSRLLSSPVAGVALSSFVFACIHPQGPGGWLGLMAFAACSCILVNRTRSLVPSMVMHAAHNGFLLTLAVLMGG